MAILPGRTKQSYAAARVSQVSSVTPDGEVFVGLETADGTRRFRVPLDSARWALQALRASIESYDLKAAQSPIWSGMPSADGSPQDEGHQV